MRSNFDKNLLPEGYGLSCLENYLLYSLIEQNVEISRLFYRSYINFSRIYNAFLGGEQYAYYSGIPRLQNVYTELGLCEQQWFTNMDDVLNALENEKYGIAICVTKEYIEEHYKVTLWRDDHFIMIAKNYDGNIIYVNDNPRDDGTLDIDSIRKNFAGQAVRFVMNGSVDYIDEKMQYDKFCQSVMQCDEVCIIDVNELTIQLLRDMIGVTRVVINRTEAICKNHIDTGFIQEYQGLLNEKFTKLEYLRIRKRYDKSTLESIAQELLEKDKIIQNQLVERIKKQYGNGESKSN